MLKRILVEQLTVGMYVKEFCGSWMHHPFWRSSFVVSDPKDIAAIRASRIKEVWIDCALGLDLAPGKPALAATEPVARLAAKPASGASDLRPIEVVPCALEFAHAEAVLAQSRQAVASMFAEARLRKAVDTQDARQMVEMVSDSVSRHPGALISLARLKTADDYTYLHSVAVCGLMIVLARQLGLDEAQTRCAGIAGLLHDLGKALIPMAVLNKPGKLTAAEFALISLHPEAGRQMLLASSGVDAEVLEAVQQHHEKADGSGYPKGLERAQISLLARMCAVCDVYDAITSNRPYKAGWDPAEALHKMAGWSKGHFDPAIFQAFVKSIGIYPIGSLLLLSCGRLGVVTEQGEQSLLNPRVKVFYSTRANARIDPQIVDLAERSCQSTIVSREDPAKWRFPDLSEIWSGLPNLPA